MEIRKDLEELREFLKKRNVVDPFAEVIEKQKKERKEREKQAEAGAEKAKAGTTESPAESEAAAPSSDGKGQEMSGEATAVPPESHKIHPRPTPLPPQPPPGKAPDDPGTDKTEPEETLERKLGKAEAIKNALIQTAGGWGFSYTTEHPVLGGAGRMDIFLTLENHRLACEICATTTPEQEAEHLLKCLGAGFTEITCVCDATVRRHRIEALLRERLMPGQEDYFHFRTVRQLQTRLTEIGEATQKSGHTYAGGKAPATPVTMTRDEQTTLAERLLAEIAERKAKAKAAKKGQN